MTMDELKKLVEEIVAESFKLSLAHTFESNALVNYACIFTQTRNEYEEIINTVSKIGTIVKDTEMGPVFLIMPIPTVAGTLRLLKIRHPDPKRLERGDADFTVSDYETFKKTYLDKPGFGIIKRPEMEMIELIDPSYNVLAYYSHPILATVLNIKLEDK